jgi:hypothetical protein
MDDAERLRLTLRWQAIEEALESFPGEGERDLAKYEAKLLQERDKIGRLLELKEFLRPKGWE